MIYVDEPIDYGAEALQRGLRHTVWAHLTADQRDELHQVAARIGLRRAWFQDDSVTWHYDVTPPKRLAALAHGARAVDWHFMGELMERRRAALEHVAPTWRAALAAAGGQCTCSADVPGHHHRAYPGGRCPVRQGVQHGRLELTGAGAVLCPPCALAAARGATPPVPAVAQATLF